MTLTTAEFDDEAGTLPLPDGMHWPPHGPMWMFADAELDPDSILFEDGFGTLAADTYYLCAWETAWVLNPKARGEALRHVEGFQQLHAWRASWDDVGKHLLIERLAAAGAGDGGGLVADVVDNCPTALAQAVTSASNGAEAGPP